MEYTNNNEQSQNETEYASFWTRLGAAVIDLILLSFVQAVVFIYMFLGQLASDWESMIGLMKTEQFMNYVYLSSLIGALYTIFMESSIKQATVGKMAFGIVVGKESGERISIANAAGRYFSKNFFVLLGSIPLFANFGVLFNFLFLAGCLLVFWDVRKQALHDKIANTYVFKLPD